MTFPKAIASLQRASVYGDVLTALDHAEALHRGLQKVDAAHLVALEVAAFAELRQLAQNAYEALAKALILLDQEVES